VRLARGLVPVPVPVPAPAPVAGIVPEGGRLVVAYLAGYSACFGGAAEQEIGDLHQVGLRWAARSAQAVAHLEKFLVGW
jgi:hypothetical protein